MSDPASTLTAVTNIHPDVAVLAPLLGTWIGQGQGIYPTIRPFGYVEEVIFGHVGKAFLSYRHSTKATDDGRPLHAEMGYVRVPTPGRVEWVIAHTSGIAEMQEGTLSIAGATIDIEVTATTVARPPSAKEVTALSRSVRFDGDDMSYTVRMAAMGQPLQQHLAATLHRQR